MPNTLSSESNPPLPSRVLTVLLDNLPLLPIPILLPHDPLLRRLPPLLCRMPTPPIHDLDALNIPHRIRDIPATQLTATAHGQDKIDLPILSLGIVLEQSRAEARPHGGTGDHAALHIVLRIELQHGLPAAPQRRIQPVEEPRQPAGGGDVRRLGVAQPLDGRHRHRGVEGSRAERDPLSHVRQQEVARRVAVQRDRQHAGGDVHPDPRVSVRADDLAAEPGAAADVEDQGGGGQCEELEAPGRHRCLDRLDPAAGGVFGCFDVGVEEVRRAVRG